MKKLFALALSFAVSWAAFNTLAQSKEFKSTWQKLIEPVFFKSQTTYNNMPAGNSEFGIFGFDGNNDYPATAKFSGNVTISNKGNKEFTFVINDGQFSAKQNGLSISYEGNYVIDVSTPKGEKCTKILIGLSGGTLYYNEAKYTINSEWANKVGFLTIRVNEKSKSEPYLMISTDDLNLPTIETVKVKMPDNMQRDLFNKKIRLAQEDSLLLYRLMDQQQLLRSLPDLTATVSVLRDGDKVINRDLIQYQLGNNIELSMLKAKRKGNTITISGDETSTTLPFNATYVLSDDLKGGYVQSITTNANDTYTNGTIKRANNTYIKNVKIKPQAFDGKQGDIYTQILKLSELFNRKAYDFNSLANYIDLSAAEYVDADGKSEMLVDNVIQSEVNKQKALAIEEIEWADKGYISINKIEIGNDYDKGNGAFFPDKLYASDIRYLTPKAEITSHTSIPREITLYVKIIDPSGNQMKNGDSTDKYTYKYTTTIDKDTDIIKFSGWGNSENSSYVPGVYKIEIWHKDKLLASHNATLTKKAKSASLYDIDPEYNVYHNNSKGFKLYYSLKTDAMRGEQIKTYVKVYKADGKTPAKYRGKSLQMESTINVNYDSSKSEGLWYFYPNSMLYEAVGRHRGTLVIKLELRDSNGKLLDQSRPFEVSWDY